MIASANLDFIPLAQAGTRGAETALVSDQPQQSFSNSLLAASNASAPTDNASGNSNGAGYGRGTATEDEHTASDSSDARTALLGGACGQPQQRIGALLTVASKASSESDRANGGSAKIAHRQKPASEAEDSSVVPDGIAVLAMMSSQQTVPVQQIVPTQQKQDANQETNSFPASFAEPVALSSASITSGADPHGVEAPDAFLSQASDSASNAVCNAIPATAEIGVQAPLPDGIANLAATAKSSAVQDAVSNAPSNAASSTVANVAVNAGQNTVSDAAQNQAANTAQNVDFTGVASAASNAPLSTDQTAARHAAFNASAKAALDSALKSTTEDQTNQSTVATAQNGLPANASFPGGTADQLASLPQADGGTVRSVVSSLNSASAAKPSATPVNSGKDAISAAAGLKQHAQSVSDSAAAQTSSQSGTSPDDQSQSGTSSQGQTAASAQMNFPNHAAAVTAPAQNPSTASSASNATPHAAVSDSGAKMAESAASAATAVAQTLPVINTAKLVRSMGQSEMRVGMRSNEFGNISINTSATKDAISAQISVDHGELAKALAAQLPEMQARLGANQAMNVRIDMNGEAAGQGTGTSGGMTNGSADQSNGGRPQSSNAASTYSSNSAAESQLSHAAVASTSYGRLNARLDIRV